MSLKSPVEGEFCSFFEMQTNTNYCTFFPHLCLSLDLGELLEVQVWGLIFPLYPDAQADAGC